MQNLKLIHQNWKVKITKNFLRTLYIFDQKKKILNILMEDFSCCGYAFSIIIPLTSTHSPPPKNKKADSYNRLS